MSGVEIAGLVLGLISSVLAIIDATKEVYDAAKDAHGLPEAFRDVSNKLPLVQETLQRVYTGVETSEVDEQSCRTVLNIIEACRTKAKRLRNIFEKVLPPADASRAERYLKAIRTRGKGDRVESLMKGILEDIQLLANNHTFVVATEEQMNGLARTIANLELTYYQPGIQDDSLVPSVNLPCLQALFLTDPVDDLAKLERLKGKRLPGTCEWLLSRPEYLKWRQAETPQLFRLSGAPGIGKSMISSFLVRHMEIEAASTTNMTFIYYFCDNKDEKRSSALAILRGLMIQLLRQYPSLFKHIQSEYDLKKTKLFSNFEAMWRIFVFMMNDRIVADLHILIDALDECDVPSRQYFLKSVRDFITEAGDKMRRTRIILTSRPERDIEDIFRSAEACTFLPVDSGSINADLEYFINIKVKELIKQKGWEQKWSEQIKTALVEQAGGTFLWTSLILEDMRQINRPRMIAEKLKKLPSTLPEVYDRILQNISDADKAIAKFILRVVVVARRPLTKSELEMVQVLNPEEEYAGRYVPTADVLSDFTDEYKCCIPLIYLDEKTMTVNLIHQSAKDYLLNESEMAKSLLYYHVNLDESHFVIFKICTRYLCMEDWKQQRNAFFPFSTREASYMEKWWEKETTVFLSYAIEEWDEHVDAAPKSAIRNKTYAIKLMQNHPKLLHTWLRRASAKNQVPVVKFLLESGAKVDDAWNRRTALSHAVQAGHEEVVEILLRNGAQVDSVNEYGKTPLLSATSAGRAPIVDLLLKSGAKVDSIDKYGKTPLWFAVTAVHAPIVDLLLKSGAKVNSVDKYGQTPLWLAVTAGHAPIVELLLKSGAEVDSVDRYGQTSLWLAAAVGHGPIVDLLLKSGALVDFADQRGQTPLSKAAQEGHGPIVDLLLKNGAHVNSVNKHGQTPLSWAAMEGHEPIVKLLLENGAQVNSVDNTGLTPLWWAATEGRESILDMLLEGGAQVNFVSLHGKTPLLRAAYYGHTKIVKSLLENGANINYVAKDGTHVVFEAIRGLYKNLNNWSESHSDSELLAVKYGYLELVRLLLDRGASLKYSYHVWDTEIKGNNTPLSLAAACDFPELVELLQAALAREPQDQQVVSESGTPMSQLMTIPSVPLLLEIGE